MKKIIVLLCLLGISYANSEEYSVSKIDEAIAGVNKTLPAKLSSTLTFESMRRDDNTIYQIYKYGNMSNYSFKQENTKIVTENILSNFCKLDIQKKIINAGYTYVFIYNTPDKDDIFRVTADKNTCNKYW